MVLLLRQGSRNLHLACTLWWRIAASDHLTTNEKKSSMRRMMKWDQLSKSHRTRKHYSRKSTWSRVLLFFQNDNLASQLRKHTASSSREKQSTVNFLQAHAIVFVSCKFFERKVPHIYLVFSSTLFILIIWFFESLIFQTIFSVPCEFENLGLYYSYWQNSVLCDRSILYSPFYLF